MSSPPPVHAEPSTRSHICQFKSAELAGIVSGPVLALVLFAALLHGLMALGILPPPRPVSSVDTAVLIHQAEASRSPQNAGLVLIGDSSCLMDVSAGSLEKQIIPRTRVLNLATLSYIDLRGHALLLAQYARANPGVLRTVVLLLHPESLRGIAPVEDHRQLWMDYFAGRDRCDTESFHGRLICGLGLEGVRGRLLSRMLPPALPGAYRQAYGFASNLERHLAGDNGSLLDPHEYRPTQGQGNAEYRLSERLEQAAGEFKASLPPGVRLVAGLTPCPNSFVAEDFADQHRQLLLAWGRWLRADALLEGMPASWPDSLFASPTHLNARGAGAYTALLSQHLGRVTQVQGEE